MCGQSGRALEHLTTHLTAKVTLLKSHTHVHTEALTNVYYRNVHKSCVCTEMSIIVCECLQTTCLQNGNNLKENIKKLLKCMGANKEKMCRVHKTFIVGSTYFLHTQLKIWRHSPNSKRVLEIVDAYF